MPKSKKTAKRARGFECLEQRALMAGDVTAAVVSGVLQITGDTNDNSILVRQSGATWKVQGVGTRVNGSFSAQSFSGVTDIAVDLLAGNDFIKVFNGTLTGDLGIGDTGGGRSIVQLAKLNATDIGILTGDESDNISVAKCQASGDLTVAAFATSDDNSNVIRIASSSAGGALDVSTDDGNDIVAISGFTAGTAIGVTTFSTDGDDDDVVTIAKANAGTLLNVATGNGGDVVAISKAKTTDDFTVVTASSTEDGNDTVSIVKSSSQGALEVDTGAGRDAAIISSFTAVAEITLTTASSSSDSNDILTLSKVTGGDNITITTGSGTDTASLTSVVAADTLSCDMEAGNYDRLVVARSRALVALFEGGGNTGDTLIRVRNRFGTETDTGFEIVV